MHNGTYNVPATGTPATPATEPAKATPATEPAKAKPKPQAAVTAIAGHNVATLATLPEAAVALPAGKKPAKPSQRGTQAAMCRKLMGAGGYSVKQHWGNYPYVQPGNGGLPAFAANMAAWLHKQAPTGSRVVAYYVPGKGKAGPTVRPTTRFYVACVPSK